MNLNDIPIVALMQKVHGTGIVFGEEATATESANTATASTRASDPAPSENETLQGEIILIEDEELKQITEDELFLTNFNPFDD